eukprot:gene11652-8035_t
MDIREGKRVECILSSHHHHHHHQEEEEEEEERSIVKVSFNLFPSFCLIL